MLQFTSFVGCCFVFLNCSGCDFWFSVPCPVEVFYVHQLYKKKCFLVLVSILFKWVERGGHVTPLGREGRRERETQYHGRTHKLSQYFPHSFPISLLLPTQQLSSKKHIIIRLTRCSLLWLFRRSRVTSLTRFSVRGVVWSCPSLVMGYGSTICFVFEFLTQRAIGWVGTLESESVFGRCALAREGFLDEV